MRFHAVVCAMALVLAACTTTVSQNEAFFGGTGQSYAFIGVPLDELETHTLIFRRVDLASSTFVGSSVTVRITPRGAEQWRRAPKDRDDAASLHFSGTKLAPGDYALVVHSVHRYLGFMTREEVNCYARGAAIYRFQEGAINVMFVPRFISGLPNAFSTDVDALQAQATKLLASYPNMTAPRVLAQPIGAARFETDKSHCKVPPSFSFTARP